MAEQAERAFITTFLSTISLQPVVYGNDYQQPPSNSLKKVPVLPIAVPPPPKRATPPAPTASTSGASTLTLTIKSLKPPASFIISVQPTDSIASIKTQLATQPNAPPADAQRLLLKGKALADAKLLQEYAVKDKDTVNLVVKSGVFWDPSASISTSVSPSQEPSSSSDAPTTLASPTPEHATKRGHQRIPSVVLSPSPSPSGETAERDILLTLDNASPVTVATETLSTYGSTVAEPQFWKNLLNFLKTEFTSEEDALTAWEDYFRATKGSLTVSQIAKVRGVVGIKGMAGT